MLLLAWNLTTELKPWILVQQFWSSTATSSLWLLLEYSISISHRKKVAGCLDSWRRKRLVFTLHSVTRASPSSMIRCKLRCGYRKKFLHETSHNKVCGLTWVTCLWFLERDIGFFKCCFIKFFSLAECHLVPYIWEKAVISMTEISKTNIQNKLDR